MGRLSSDAWFGFVSAFRPNLMKAFRVHGSIRGQLAEKVRNVSSVASQSSKFRAEVERYSISFS